MEMTRKDRIFFDEIEEQFVFMADQDYIASRLAFWNGMAYPFVWMGGQALEKYLKASLLVRKRKIWKNHDLIWHFDQLKELENFTSPVLQAPTNEFLARNQNTSILTTLGDWDLYSDACRFLKKLSGMCQPDLRYGKESYEVVSADLLRIDQLVFQLRNDFFKQLDCDINFDVNETQFGQIHLEELGAAAQESLKWANHPFYPESDAANFDAGIGLDLYNRAWRPTRISKDPNFAAADAELKSLICRKKPR